MKFCQKCGVHVNTDRENCPLCNGYLTGENSNEKLFPDKVVHYDKKSYHFLFRLFLFLSIISVFASVLINALTWEKAKHPWCLIIFCGILYTWFLIKNSIMKRQNVMKMIILQLVTVSLLVITIDLVTTNEPFGTWALPYVFPLLCFGTSIVITILVSVMYLKYKSYLFYLVVVLTLGIIPIILCAFGLTHGIWWPSIVSVSYSFVALTGLIVFADRKVKDEITKRFHL